MQRKAALWILEAFKMSPFFSIKAIAGLIPIYLHFQKLSGRLQLRVYTLPNNHILHSLLKFRLNILSYLHCLSLEFLTKHQCKLIKGPVIDMDNRFNKVFPSFDSFNPESTLGCRIIDFFFSYFFFIFSTSITRIVCPLILAN